MTLFGPAHIETSIRITPLVRGYFRLEMTYKLLPQEGPVVWERSTYDDLTASEVADLVSIGTDTLGGQVTAKGYGTLP